MVIGTPMHNMTAPAALKAWIDHVVRARRTFDVTPAGKVGLLDDRPVFVAVASGGRFTGERARQPDFLTPYLRAVLGMVGLRDLTFFSVQGTGAGLDAVAEARAGTDRALAAHFTRVEAKGQSTFRRDFLSTVIRALWREPLIQPTVRRLGALARHTPALAVDRGFPPQGRE